ncbi:MAG: hypothetical protein ABJC09_06910 [Terriglobia bacterium]
MSTFLDNGRRIFEVARAESTADDIDFALMVREDGGLHLIMESPLSLEGAAVHAGAATGYRVTRSSGALKICGQSYGESLVLEDRTAQRSRHSRLLRDQPLYRITSPLLTSAPS